MRWLGLLAALLCLSAPAETLEFRRFGTLNLYRPEAAPRRLVLFFSGDGGWNLGVINMAQQLTRQHAVVAGIDSRHYLAALESAAESCVSPADEMQALGRFLQQSLALPTDLRPVLVGYSSGATLVYAALVQAPAGRFQGALGLGFCPDLELKKPLCTGAGLASAPRRDRQDRLQGVDLLPTRTLSAPWIGLQGALDQVCPAAPTQQFMAAVPGAEFVLLPKVGHGYGVAKNWVPQYEQAFRRIVEAKPLPPDGAHAAAH